MPVTPEQKRAYRLADKERGKKRITLTLTEEEYEFVEKRAQFAKEKITPYFKNCALHYMADRRHLNQEELELKRQLIIELRRIGNNVNQIAYNANAGFSLQPEALKQQLLTLETTIKNHFNT